ncbi:hypothetical protein BJ878DRAFT_268535 [Calycina marina]|uniref:Uncharacterized protein n=1 Tax=Calycina marina TaxID=1763456 RepID=A0A9P7YW76_9HELO|nr:hypothetical protein BJ878DRAFT_268535 [Calycina marina]
MTELVGLAELNSKVLKTSRLLHNHFPPDSAFPRVNLQSKEFSDLCALLTKYNAHETFLLRLLHHHTQLPEGSIMLGTKTEDPKGYWTRPVAMANIQVEIHGHIFSVDPRGNNGRGILKALLFLLPSIALTDLTNF